MDAIYLKNNCMLSISSEIIGWAYTIFFSVSYYPQIAHFVRTKSVKGFSLDGAHMAFISNVLYALYNWAFKLDEGLRNKYEILFGSENLIQPNDAWFASQASVASFITSTLGLYYSYRENGRVVFNYTLLGKITIAFTFIAIAILLILISSNCIDFIYLFLGFSIIKAIYSVTLYLPQLCTNYRLKSTRGFAIWGVFLDMSGGILSLIQLFIDSSNCENAGSIIWGNPSKFGIGVWSVFVNSLFIIQYVYYDSGKSGYSLAPRESKDEESIFE
jgi:cystinosin